MKNYKIIKLVFFLFLFLSFSNPVYAGQLNLVRVLGGNSPFWSSTLEVRLLKGFQFLKNGSVIDDSQIVQLSVGDTITLSPQSTTGQWFVNGGSGGSGTFNSWQNITLAPAFGYSNYNSKQILLNGLVESNLSIINDISPSVLSCSGTTCTANSTGSGYITVYLTEVPRSNIYSWDNTSNDPVESSRGMYNYQISLNGSLPTYQRTVGYNYAYPIQINVSPAANQPPVTTCSGVTDITSTSAKINWTYSDAEPQEDYQVLIATDSGFTNIVKNLVKTSIADGTNNYRIVDSLQPNTTYYAKVRTYSNSTYSEYSTCGQFVTNTNYPLSVIIAGTGTGYVNSNPSGISCQSGVTTGCSASYSPNTNVSLNASVSIGSGSEIVSWSGGGCEGSTSSCAVNMNSSKTVTVTINKINFPLTVTKKGAGSGTVTSSIAGISCGADCTESYPVDTSLTLTATPTAGSTFGGWTEAPYGSNPVCSGVNPCNVSVDRARNIDATFNTGPLTLTFHPNGGYKFGGSTAVITQEFNQGETKKLAQNEFIKANEVFSGWNELGQTRIYADKENFTMGSSNVNLYANWVPVTYAITYFGNGNTGGTVPQPQSKQHGVNINLRKNNGGDEGSLWKNASRLSGWKISPASTNILLPGSIFSSNASISLYANWVAEDYTLTVWKEGTGLGAVTSEPTGISVSDSFPNDSQAYSQNASVTLTASPENGSFVESWLGGGCEGSTSSCAVTLNTSKTVTVKFEPNNYSIIYNGNGNTGGSAPSSQTKQHNIDAIIKGNENSLTRDGFDISGWNTSADGSGINYGFGSSYSANANLSLFAKWTANATPINELSILPKISPNCIASIGSPALIGTQICDLANPTGQTIFSFSSSTPNTKTLSSPGLYTLKCKADPTSSTVITSTDFCISNPTIIEK